MAFVTGDLLERLQALTIDISPARWLVAYSGGIDSTVLLHALVRCKQDVPILAIHVDHDLDASSESWAMHCKTAADDLNVKFEVHKVCIPENPEGGVEAAARRARYEVFLSCVQDGDCLLSAHHENDQAETILLNLMRGSGPAGLAGIGVCQTFGRGTLLRPLIDSTRGDLETYAAKHRLSWIEDPSNADSRYDRNFVRREVLPLLTSRWPAAVRSLRQSAGYVGEASDLLKELADIDLDSCGTPERLSLKAMAKLTSTRQRNLIRHAIRLQSLPPPPAKQLFQVINEVIKARNDAQPTVKWSGTIIRRYRDYLYILAPEADLVKVPENLLKPGGELIALGPGQGTLALVNSDGVGLDPRVTGDGLSVRYRGGGEEIRIEVRGTTRKLKKLFQEAGVFPWMRERIPLLYADESLVAVGNLWVSADHVVQGGLRVEWKDRPALI